jgi:phospholipid/cholesterol/gamma-HCH transport system permease protein
MTPSDPRDSFPGADGGPPSSRVSSLSTPLWRAAPVEPSLLRTSIQRLLIFVDHLGMFSLMTARAARALFARPFEWRAIVYQMESVGVRSLSIASVTAVFIGMVMAVQFAISLQKFGAMEYTGRVVGLSFSRELAPTLTAVIVGGRVGAGMAAEVGSMAVTEQIDAIRALGADPIKKLVLPRAAAAVIVMPLLSIFALLFGFCGAMIVISSQFNIPAGFFLRSAIDSVAMNDFLSGICKSPVFGAIIALVGCHFGLTTTGGTEGVGRSTTRTVVVVSIAILIADFFLTKIYFWAFG